MEPNLRPFALEPNALMFELYGRYCVTYTYSYTYKLLLHHAMVDNYMRMRSSEKGSMAQNVPCVIPYISAVENFKIFNFLIKYTAKLV